MMMAASPVIIGDNKVVRRKEARKRDFSRRPSASVDLYIDMFDLLWKRRQDQALSQKQT